MFLGGQIYDPEVDFWLKKLKNILYDGKNHNYSIKLADKIINSNNKFSNKKTRDDTNYNHSDNNEKIIQILNKMRSFLENNEY